MEVFFQIWYKKKIDLLSKKIIDFVEKRDENTLKYSEIYKQASFLTLCEGKTISAQQTTGRTTCSENLPEA